MSTREREQATPIRIGRPRNRLEQAHDTCRSSADQKRTSGELRGNCAESAGVPYPGQLERIRETAEIVRLAMTGAPLHFEGSQFQLHAEREREARLPPSTLSSQSSPAKARSSR